MTRLRRITIKRHALDEAVRTAASLRELATAIEAVLLPYANGSDDPNDHASPLDDATMPEDVAYGLGAIGRDVEDCIDGLRRCGVAWNRPEPS